MASLGDKVRVKIVDSEDQEMLVAALQEIDVVLSALNSVTAIRIDRLLLETGKAAGVRKIFPSEYTLDVLHAAGHLYNNNRVRHVP